MLQSYPFLRALIFWSSWLWSAHLPQSWSTIAGHFVIARSEAYWHALFSHCYFNFRRNSMLTKGLIRMVAHVQHKFQTWCLNLVKAIAMLIKNECLETLMNAMMQWHQLKLKLLSNRHHAMGNNWNETICVNLLM